MNSLQAFIAVVFLVSAGFAATDDFANRPDLYGPAATQWNYTTACVNTTIKSTPGTLRCVHVSSAPAAVWSIRDASSAGGSVVISTFPASMTPGSYCYDAVTATGIQLVISNGHPCSITTTWR